jgi:aspartate/methionine/tyrosine aminotransferase
MVSKRAQQVESGAGYARFFTLARQLKNPCNLSWGQPHWDVEESIKQAAIDAIQAGRNAYTPVEGIEPLRTAVKANYTQRGFVPEEVVVTPGVTGGLLLSILALADPGDEIVMADPYYLASKSLALLFGCVPRFVNTYPDFKWRREALEAAITPKTKAIIVTSPANPTGHLLSHEEAQMIADVAAKHDLWIIHDELYWPFNYVGRDVLLAKLHPKTITLNGFSKSHSMTGWRVGVAVGPAEILRTFVHLQQYCHICAPSVGQWAAIAALDMHPHEGVDNYRRNRDYLVDNLKSHYELINPQGAFFIYLKAPKGMKGSEFSERAAVDHQLLMFPGNVFSEQDTHVRVSYGVDDSSLERGVELLKKMAV